MLLVTIIEDLRSIIDSDGEEEFKLLGVFSSQEQAEKMVQEHYRLQSGFCEYPEIIRPSEYDEENGFVIGPYEIDRLYWPDGFISESEIEG